MWRHLVGKEPNFGREFLLSETAPPELRQTIRHYFAKLVVAQGRKRLAFKHTGPPKIGYLLSIFPDAVFINIRRSAIPTINSLLNTKFWRAGGSQQLYWTGPYSSEEERWVNDNKNHPELITALQVKKVSWAEQTEIELHKPNILTVNYETFTIAPRREVERILDFCGLPDDPKTNEYLLNNPIVQRNLPDESYFETDVLKELYGVLNSFQ